MYQTLKNNKACSDDGIINENIKVTAHKMMPLYVAFFNLIFDSGILPDSRLEGIIRPIYKSKGDTKSPENYRPITILSCFCKLFTFILNPRLNQRTNGPVIAHLISCPTKAQNIQNLENIW